MIRLASALAALTIGALVARNIQAAADALHAAITTLGR